jgi:septum formation protein
VIADLQPIAGSRPDALVLASASPTRALLLRRAGVPFRQDAAAIDEAVAKRRCRQAQMSARAAALELARAKAEWVAGRHPDRLVLGCDQLLDCAGAWLDKPRSRIEASAQLIQLSGRTHRLATAAVLVRDGREVWAHAEEPELEMRQLTPQFIEAYLDAAGPAVLGSVGAYQLEGLGAQLFTRVRGDHFAVLGLPLMALLEVLRREGVLP